MRQFHFIVFIIIVWLPLTIFATHNRAGEITYKHITGYTFEFKITTYTYRWSEANRMELNVEWGDGSSSVVPIVNPPGHYVIPGTDYYMNTYIAVHTYPGAGIYEILMEDPNRNQGVNNIPNSVNTIFSIKTTMLVGSGIGWNNTPVLLNKPIDKAAKGHIFIHNPGAFDLDGDSLSYEITTCTGANGQPIEGYILPAATDTLFIDDVTGDLEWITPSEVGVYNIAILIEEWRKGVRIGKIARDMQIDVFETDNIPPVNPDLPDLCVEAGDVISFSFTTTDANGDFIKQEMVGGPFEVSNPAVYSVTMASAGSATAYFLWNTNCSNARQQPYNVILKSEDINDDIPLVDITSFSIIVLPSAPENLTLIPGVDSIRLEWDASSCGQPEGYNIYRRVGYYGFDPDSCENGVPAYTGYGFIDQVNGAATVSYKDDNHGEGLVPGYDYCYMITAFYNDGVESFASAEMCTTLIAGTPPILQVSVLSDHETEGDLEIKWAVPMGVDTIDDGPYRYQVLRRAPNAELFASIATIDSPDLQDTSYVDENINTLIFPYTYSVILYYEEGGNWYQLPNNETATSQYLIIDGSDNALLLNMKKRSPWLNYRYDVFRQNNASIFAQVGSTDESAYIDDNLQNNTEYTYRTVGFGSRPLYNTIYSVENISHIASGIPVDTIPPCVPDLFVTSECDSIIGYNMLSWEENDSCNEHETLKFRIYYRPSIEGDFVVIDSVSPDVYSYRHYPDSSFEGCYALTAIDSSYNECQKIPFCISNLCGLYSLPNVFTPDADDIGDIYKSLNQNHIIKKVTMTIYNRYGKQVYKTGDPDINWNGRGPSGKLVSQGVYYYICDVYEPRITGIVVRTLTGFIHVFSGEFNDEQE